MGSAQYSNYLLIFLKLINLTTELNHLSLILSVSETDIIYYVYIIPF